MSTHLHNHMSPFLPAEVDSVDDKPKPASESSRKSLASRSPKRPNPALRYDDKEGSAVVGCPHRPHGRVARGPSVGAYACMGVLE